MFAIRAIKISMDRRCPLQQTTATAIRSRPPAPSISMIGMRAHWKSWTNTNRSWSILIGGLTSMLSRHTCKNLLPIITIAQRSGGKGAVISSKHEAFPEGIAVLDVERGQLNAIHPHVWQTDTSISTKSWGYIQEHEYRERGCADRRSGGYCQQERNILVEYRTAPGRNDSRTRAKNSPGNRQVAGHQWRGNIRHAPLENFRRRADANSSGEFTDSHREPFTSEDIRFTTKGNVLYAIVLACAQDSVTIRSLASHPQIPGGAISNITLVGSSEPLEWSQNELGLTVRLPEQLPCEHAFVLRVLLRTPAT